MTTIRLLVVDDHPVVRDGLVAMLETQPDFEIIGAEGSGAGALARLAEGSSDLVLLDLEMPGMDGVEVIRHLHATHPDVRVLVFTAFDTDEKILAAVQAGAQGYLLKGAPRQEIFRAIRTVSEGGSLLEPLVATRLLRHVSDQAAGMGPVPEPLTNREQDVLAELAQGKTNREIAESLVISERTVKFHVSAILGKLGASNRTEAVSLAVQQGLVDLTP